MHVIRDGDDDGVNVLALLIQHLAEIFELRGAFVFLKSLGRPLIIHIAERHDVLVGASLDVAGRFAARTNRGNVQLFIGGFVPHLLQGRGGTIAPRWNRSRQKGAVKEISSGKVFSHKIPRANERDPPSQL